MSAAQEVRKILDALEELQKAGVSLPVGLDLQGLVASAIRVDVTANIVDAYKPRLNQDGG